MAPEGVPVNRENRPPPERAKKYAPRTKAGAKVLLFFEMTKFFCIFFANMGVFL
jgi:hypothetical protein